jgi:hypothetical protein
VSTYTRCDGCGEEQGASRGWIGGTLHWATSTISPSTGNPIGFVQHSPRLDFCSFICAEQWAHRKQLPPKVAAT